MGALFWVELGLFLIGLVLLLGALTMLGATVSAGAAVARSLRGARACREGGREVNSQEIAERGCILRAVVGSTLHGLALDGQDDTDEMGVCIEPPEYVLGLRQFEQWVHRTKPQGVRSEPGDLDVTIYSLRKWCRLALRGMRG